MDDLMKENANVQRDFEIFLEEHNLTSGILIYGYKQIAGGCYCAKEEELIKLFYNAAKNELAKTGNSPMIAAALNALIELMGVPRVVNITDPSNMN